MRFIVVCVIFNACNVFILKDFYVSIYPTDRTTTALRASIGGGGLGKLSPRTFV